MAMVSCFAKNNAIERLGAAAAAGGLLIPSDILMNAGHEILGYALPYGDPVSIYPGVSLSALSSCGLIMLLVGSQLSEQYDMKSSNFDLDSYMERAGKNIYHSP